jgi:RHS repeat-associated protein
MPPMNKEALTGPNLKRLAGAALLLALLAPTTQAAVTETRSTAYVYDSKGQVVRELIEPQDSSLCLVTEYTYDGHGNRASAQPRNCNGTSTIPGVGTEAAKPTGSALFTTGAVQVRHDYPGVNSATERKITTTNALGHQGVEVQDTAFGTPLSRSDANGLVTRWRYDGFGRKTLEQEPDGSGTRWLYETCNVDSATTCPPDTGIYRLKYRLTHYEVSGANVATDAGTKNGPYGRTYHDNLDRVVVEESEGWDGAGAARPIRQMSKFDTRGRLAEKSRPYYADQGVPAASPALYEHDVLGRLTLEMRFDNGLTRTTYDGLTIRREVAVVDTATASTTQTTHTLTETRNALGQVASVTDTLGKAMTRSYTPWGDLQTSTDSAGNTITVSYNLRGHKTRLVDPDLGTWTYENNALGQLVKQTDALAKSTTLEYDLLGRLKRRVEPDHESRWAYDTQYADASACANAKGRLCEASTTSGYSRKLAYDSLGRPTTTTTKADVTGGTGSYQDDLSYNARGQVATRTYPGAAGQRLSLTHTYTTLGYLKSVKNTSTGTVYWSAGQQDEYGNLTQQVYGNGVTTTRSFDFMQRLLTSAAGTGNAVQNDSYSYDHAGNLRSRTETRAGAILTSQYDYDNLNRLKTEARSGGAVSGTQTLTWSYDDIGNLSSRSDVGSYTYPASGANAVRPHAVSSITGTVNGVTNPGYSYDANGNILTSAGRSATWTSFNLPATLTRGPNQLSWLYDSEHERVREQLKVNGTLTRTTVYVNPAAGAGLFYEEEIAGSVVKRRHYINGGEGAMAVLTRQSGVADEVRYWHKDHLDSNTVVTNESGAVVERLEYEPFGKRRKADNTTDAAGTLTALSTDRGFTEHEMLDEVGLIHMNGRIFDPAIGRFLSADPSVPHPDDMQSYNHYSYARNRPLSMVDPSGFDDWLRRNPEINEGSSAAAAAGAGVPSPQAGAGASGGQTNVPNGGNVVGFDPVLSWNNSGGGAPTVIGSFPPPAATRREGGWLVENVLEPLSRATEPMIGLGPFGGEVPVALKAIVLMMTVEKAGQEGAALAKVVQVAKAAEALKAAEAAKAVQAAKEAGAAFKDFNQARNAAVQWLEARGFKAEQATLGKFGENAGKPIGMKSADGRVGFRVEYDARNGAHINVWAGKEKGPHFTFEGTQSMVDQIVKQFVK